MVGKDLSLGRNLKGVGVVIWFKSHEKLKMSGRASQEL